MAAAVMGDDAIAVLEEEQHLRVPVVGRQRPAVAEHDGLTRAPVLVEDLDAVLGGDRAHTCSPCRYVTRAPREVTSLSSPIAYSYAEVSPSDTFDTSAKMLGRDLGPVAR